MFILIQVYLSRLLGCIMFPLNLIRVHSMHSRSRSPSRSPSHCQHWCPANFQGCKQCNGSCQGMDHAHSASEMCLALEHPRACAWKTGKLLALKTEPWKWINNSPTSSNAFLRAQYYNPRLVLLFLISRHIFILSANRLLCISLPASNAVTCSILILLKP